MRSILLLLLLLHGPFAFAQKQVLVLPGKLLSQQRFRPFAEKRNERASFSDWSIMVTWLRFTIRNSHPTDTLRLFYGVWAHMDILTYAGERPINRGNP